MRGEIRTDKDARKKHVTDMREDEKALASSLSRRRFHLSEHAVEEMAKDGITRLDVFDAVLFGRLVEFSLSPRLNRPRTLLRAEDGRGGRAVCVVLELRRNSNDVITAYVNAADDNHDTLAERFYTLRDDITPILTGVLDEN